MTESTVAVVGSGIAGTTIAYLLASQGIDVQVFEKGPEYPFPYARQFHEDFMNRYVDPADELARHLRQIRQVGDVNYDLDTDRRMRVGGMATSWHAISLRMFPSDFRTQTLFGRGQDWPIDYDTLEPYYSRAEAFIGVSGSDTDNPFAPPRSQPYPMPAFELSEFETRMADRLRDHGIALHTTPQARNRLAYEGRAGCQNYGACYVCPIGARYAPTHHLQLALQTGFCNLQVNTAVRRIIVDRNNKARGLLVHDHTTGQEYEHNAEVVVLAPGAVETVRLLMLSANEQHADGLGNAGGQLGKRHAFHQIRWGLLRYPERVYPGRTGPATGESHQFADHENRDAFGGVKVEYWDVPPREDGVADSTFEALNNLEDASDFFLHTRWIVLHPESDMTEAKYIDLSDDERDPFGDPIPRVHHESSEFDHLTFEYTQDIFQQFKEGTQAESGFYTGFDEWRAWAHHMGGARMGTGPDDSVVNEYLQVHGIDNLFTAGASSFVETSALNPTLTIVALAMRTADYLLDQRLADFTA